MKICLVSKQQTLIALCREVLEELRGDGWELVISDTSSLPADGKLFIWDYEPGLDLSAVGLPELWGRHLLLAHRSELARLRDLLRTGMCWVLLKPVNRVALQSFLQQCCGLAARIARLEEARDTILECLLETNIRLQDYDQQRTNFLARAVHDLRAPLMALSGYCGLLLSQQLGSLANAQLEVLRRMQHSIKRLTRIVTATLELSTGRLVEAQPEWQEVDIHQCVDQALYEMMPVIEEKNLAVTVNLEPPVKPLRGDVFQIEQVLVNLLDNACKFTPRNGRVDLHGYSWFWERRSVRVRQPWLGAERRLGRSAQGNAYRLDISDTGPQVPESRLREIFQEYTPYAGSRDRSGGGLGLAICRMIVKAHQGEIFARNTPEGFGVAVVLPYPAEDGTVALAKSVQWRALPAEEPSSERALR